VTPSVTEKTKSGVDPPGSAIATSEALAAAAIVSRLAIVQNIRGIAIVRGAPPRAAVEHEKSIVV
jgi:hypothetical protein